MKRVLPFLLLIFLSIFWAGMYFLAEEPIQIDTAFEDALEKELGIAAGTFDKNKVKDISELDLSNYQITDVKGIEHFRSLEVLNLSNNLLTEMDGIEQLENLRIVDLSFNDLSTISFESSGITRLDLEGNVLTDVSFISDLPQLQHLTIRDNQIRDISPLSAAETLTYLNARGNQIDSVEALQGLVQLSDINLRNNQIKDVNPLASLPAITERLYLTGNGIKDYMPLETIIGAINDIDFELSPPPPVLSAESGVINSGTAVSMESSIEEAKIYYTLDGSLPTPASLLYTEPIVLEESLINDNDILANIGTSVFREPFQFTREEILEGIVIRAAVYHNRTLSEVETRSYILNDALFSSSQLPVVSLTTDPEGLFNEERGIYVPGIYYENTRDTRDGNYFKRGDEWERPATLEYFSEDGALEYSQNIGIRIHGGYSREHPQKSLRLYSRSDYGQSRMYYPFFKDDANVEFNRLMLRNSGNDWGRTYLRDALMHELIKDRNVDTQNYQPVIVLLNGEYWGIQNLREAYSAEYLETKYNLNAEEIVMLGTDVTNATGFIIDEGLIGDQQHYTSLVEYAMNNDLRIQENLDYVNTQMDVENYLEYFAYQVYFGNTDSLYNNTAMWRKKTDYTPEAPYGQDGRWRWLLYDTDFGFALNGEFEETINDNTLDWLLRDHPATELIRALLENEEVYAQLISIMEGLLDEEFAPENVIETINSLSGQIRGEMPRMISRWENINSIETWEAELDMFRQFAQRRPEAVMNYLNERLERTPD
ncbi:CotH kinase family protein [Jeotgalibacillus proteolyticus]|uniref:GH29D-like beta-sandwich domain-containing protein n=1 Tax=Jeotgalibacillus proteolyticus TaxID=2082395 RepID=A0A2S5GBD2_9BACL|nr:CotH kinase family protein [Jeotgalibacillus proteolyticus]PPA70268.1 hypothetical protein C4B60_11855 [Jeotgalibacillus proteolyticus]